MTEQRKGAKGNRRLIGPLAGSSVLPMASSDGEVESVCFYVGIKMMSCTPWMIWLH